MNSSLGLPIRDRGHEPGDAFEAGNIFHRERMCRVVLIYCCFALN